MSCLGWCAFLFPQKTPLLKNHSKQKRPRLNRSRQKALNPSGREAGGFVGRAIAVVVEGVVAQLPVCVGKDFVLAPAEAHPVVRAETKSRSADAYIERSLTPRVAGVLRVDTAEATLVAGAVAVVVDVVAPLGARPPRGVANAHGTS